MGGARTSTLRALRGQCPGCGEGRIFDGLLAFRPSCQACGISFDDADVGDGASWFVTLLAGGMATGGAIALEAWLRPPVWVHAAAWIPVVLLSSILLLRPFRAWLLSQCLRHGRVLGPRDDDGGR